MEDYLSYGTVRPGPARARQGVGGVYAVTAAPHVWVLFMGGVAVCLPLSQRMDPQVIRGR